MACPANIWQQLNSLNISVVPLSKCNPLIRSCYTTGMHFKACNYSNGLNSRPFNSILRAPAWAASSLFHYRILYQGVRQRPRQKTTSRWATMCRWYEEVENSASNLSSFGVRVTVLVIKLISHCIYFNSVLAMIGVLIWEQRGAMCWFINSLMFIVSPIVAIHTEQNSDMAVNSSVYPTNLEQQ